MMSNRIVDPLFQLIHSLEKAEKRHFKLYIKRNSAKEDLKVIQLFDAVAALPEYDERVLLKKLTSIEKPQLANLKTHLYKQLLASLRLLKSNDSVDLQLHEQLDYAHQLLEQVGLSGDFFERYPHELSGGQRQRVVIARALATAPKILICDESVAALDISVQAQVLNLLNRLKKELGLSYLFISHDLSVVKYMSDRVMVMEQGKLVELQEADALYAHPKHPYTQKLIDAIPQLS